MPVIRLNSVVLPAPFGPITLTTSSSFTTRSRSAKPRSAPPPSELCQYDDRGDERDVGGAVKARMSAWDQDPVANRMRRGPGIDGGSGRPGRSERAHELAHGEPEPRGSGQDE